MTKESAQLFNLSEQTHLGDLSSLICATQNGYVNSLAVMHRHGIDIKARDANGHSLLYHAVVHGQAEVVTWLLRHEFDPEVTFDNKPIMVIAGMHKHRDIFQILLNAIKAKKIQQAKVTDDKPQSSAANAGLFGSSRQPDDKPEKTKSLSPE